MKTFLLAACIAICTPATAGQPTQGDQKTLRWTIEVTDTASDGSGPEHVVTWYDVAVGEKVRSGEMKEAREDMETSIGMEIFERDGRRFLRVENGESPVAPGQPEATFEMILNDAPASPSTGSHSMEPRKGSMVVRRTYVATPSSRRG